MLVLHREVPRQTDIPNGGLEGRQLEQRQSRACVPLCASSAVLRVYDKPVSNLCHPQVIITAKLVRNISGEVRHEHNSYHVTYL